MKVNSEMLLCKFPLSVWVMTTLSGYKVTAVNMSTYRRQRGGRVLLETVRQETSLVSHRARKELREARDMTS